MSTTQNWIVATPCPKCDHNDNCKISADGSKLWCGRVSDGSVEQNTGGQYLHILIPTEDRKGSKPVEAKPTGDKADVDTLHAVYSALINELPLSNSHRENLLARKAPQAFGIHGYVTMPLSGRARVVRKLRENFDDATLLTVPGIILKAGDRGDYLTLAGSPGLLIPVRDIEHRIIAIKIRCDDATGGGRYKWFSSKNAGGPSPSTEPHVPLDLNGPTPILRLTEGPIKADVAQNLNCVPTIAADAVGSWAKTIPIAQQLGARTIRLAFDRDCESNPDVAAKLVRCAEGYEKAGFEVEVETWDKQHKGIDDALVAGVEIKVLAGEDGCLYLQWLVEQSPAKQAAAAVAGRVEVEVLFDEYKTNDAAVVAITNDPTIYQKAGRLVHVVCGAKLNDGIRRPDDAPRIVAIPLPIIREKLTRRCFFYVEVEEEEGVFVQKQKSPPDWTVKAVAERGQWDGIRPLTGIVNSPVLRSDGTILCTPGYDPATALIFDPQGVEFPPVPENPTHDEARHAAEVVLDVVCEFPFANPEHRAAWLAFLFTMIARHAFSGPSPLFLADANVRGSGKTILLVCGSLIATGRDFARVSNSADDTEWDKRLLSIALSGDPSMLIDNVDGQLGCPTLDAALTSTSWKGRILGKSEVVELPLLVTWAASGNNTILAADTARRTCHIRLASPLENPEERTGFKYPNVLRHVRENRPALLVAALTVLRGFCAAGRPDQKLKPWGSFEGWSDLVRQAIVWTDLPDPGDTREQLREFSDRGAGALRAVIASWGLVDPENRGLTASELCHKIEPDRSHFFGTERADTARPMRDAILELCGSRDGKIPSPVTVGNRLKKIRGRFAGGNAIDCQPNRDGVMVWMLVAGAAGVAGAVPSASAAKIPGTRSQNGSGHTLCVRESDISIGNGAEIAPAAPATPAGDSDWLSSVPLVTVVNAGDLKHKSPSCGACSGWRLIGGDMHCFTCWPPTDPVAVQHGPP